jgi:NAD(P)-dependent dehydrogenase (short-subunit alcohol dehydrogenase family)
MRIGPVERLHLSDMEVEEAHSGPPASRFTGRRAIVTGAARGIGAAIARRLASEGATVGLLDLDRTGVESRCDDLRSAFPAASHLSEVVDLADPISTVEVTARLIERLGGLDILVNNAGVFDKTALQHMTVASWDRMMAINARAPFLTMKCAFPALAAAGSGRIVNIASLAAKEGAPGEAHYAASKAAVVALTRVAAKEMGESGVTVNCVCPGYVLTDMGAEGRSEEDIASWTARSPLGRLGCTEDVAGTVAFLCSADGAYLTGQAINVTGGMFMS